MTSLKRSGANRRQPAWQRKKNCLLCLEELEPRLVLSSLYVSTNGSDSNSGASPTSALGNIQTALNRASPGMTIYVAAGTYYEHLVTNVSGAAGQLITLTSYNGTVAVDGSTQTWTPGGDQNLGVIELRNPYYTVQGIEVINSKDTGIVLGANHLTITNSTVAETDRHAISTDTQFQTASGLGFMLNDITITNNLVYDAVLLGHGYGQAISLIADGFRVSGNTVRNNVTEGIDIWLGAKHGEVDHNVVYSNGAAGIYMDGAAYLRIDDNRVYSNPRGIGVSSENPNYSTHDIWVYNNLSYNNTGSGIFIWDSPTNPGFHGSQNVLIANNTLVNNSTAIVLQGDSNTAEIMNNLGYSTGTQIDDTSTNSTYNIHNNVWLTSLTGFVSPSTANYQLTSTSPAINQGAPLPLLQDDLGDSFVISTDFLGLNRNVNGVDAGAYEYQ
jgi:parallel beta-helix repeat protein